MPVAIREATAPAPTRAIPLWIRLLLLICSWITPLLLLFSTVVRELYEEGLEEYRLAHSRPARSALQSSLRVSIPRRCTPTRFWLFGALPTELRLMIWTEALPPARLLLLRLPPSAAPAVSPWSSFLSSRPPRPSTSANPISPGLGDDEPEPPHIFSCSAPPPALLAVNFESRSLALRHYRLGLAPTGYPGSPRVYVNFARDVVALSDAVMCTYAGRSLLRLTPDLGRVAGLCLPEGGAAERALLGTYVGRTVVRKVGPRAVCIVRSRLLADGLEVPIVAKRDWGYWVRWMERDGRVRWVGEEAGEGEGDGVGEEGGAGGG